MRTISNDAARYSFLARPPPQKKKPTQALPSPPIAVAIPVSTTTPVPNICRRASGIAAWAALVQPGSPAPNSPPRRTSISNLRRPSLTHRRLSISHSRAASGSLLGLIHTPTSAQDIEVDLGAFGYTSVFVDIPPKTPLTPCHPPHTPMKLPLVLQTAINQPSSPKKSSTAGRTIKRFRSLGGLRPRSKSTTGAIAALPSSPTRSSVAGICARAELVAKRKKAKYPHVRPPPSIAHDVALMQFTAGGSVENNAHILMAARARAAGGTTGVDDVFRDEKGGIWLDQDEEMEYAHLLGSNVDGDLDSQSQWVKFGNGKSSEDGISPRTAIADLAGSNDKRESWDSDLSPQNIVLPAEEMQCEPEDAVLSYSPPSGSPFSKQHTSAVAAGRSVLSLPSRPSRPTKHLRKPGFLLDMAAFAPRSPVVQIRTSPKSRQFPSSTSPISSHYTPTTSVCAASARFSSAFVQLPPAPGSGNSKKLKRRPAPLQLASNNAGWKRVEVSRTPVSRAVSNSTASVGVVAEARREFVEASFAPQPVVHRVSVLVPTVTTTAIPSPDVATTTRPRRKIVIASLDPMDDMIKCREWAAASGMIGDPDLDVDGDVNMYVSRSTGNVAKKKRLGFGGFFGKK